MNGPVEFELADKQFLIRQLPPVEQFHIMRRFGKVQTALAKLREDLKEDLDVIEGEDVAISIRKVQIAMGLLMTAFGELEEEEVNYILSHCLNKVQIRNDKGTWANIWSAGGLVFQDLTYDMLLTLTMQVIQENIGPFSPAPPAPPPGTTDQAA